MRGHSCTRHRKWHRNQLKSAPHRERSKSQARLLATNTRSEAAIVPAELRPDEESIQRAEQPFPEAILKVTSEALQSTPRLEAEGCSATRVQRGMPEVDARDEALEDLGAGRGWPLATPRLAARGGPAAARTPSTAGKIGLFPCFVQEAHTGLSFYSRTTLSRRRTACPHGAISMRNFELGTYSFNLYSS